MAKGRYLFLAKFYFDSTVSASFEGAAPIRVVHPAYVYEGSVLSIEPIDRSIGILPGLPQISGTTVRVADTHRKWRDLAKANPTRRSLVDIIGVKEGGSESADGQLVYSGEVINPEFGPAFVDFKLKDHLYAFLDEKFPPMIVSEIHPETNPKNEGGFLNVILGSNQSVGANPRGVVPVPHVGISAGLDRYGLACHPVAELTNVYRNGPDGWAVVDPGEYALVPFTTVAFNQAMTHSMIDFFELQKGAEIRADVEGFYWGANVPMTNPVDAFLVVSYFYQKFAGFDVSLDPLTLLSGRFDPDSWLNLRALFESLGYRCDGTIAESLAYREFVGRWCTSFNSDVFVNNNGLIAVNFTDPATTGTPSVTLSKGKYIERNTFYEKYPDTVIHQMTFRYANNPARGLDSFDISRTASTGLAAETTTSENVEKGTVDFYFIRDAALAADIVTRRMRFLDPTCYRQEFTVPLPPLLPLIDLAQPIALTHDQGIGLEDAEGYDGQEVKILGLTYDPNKLRIKVRTIIGVDREISFQELGDSETEGEGGTGETSDTDGECCGGFIFETTFVDEPEDAKDGDADFYTDGFTIGRFTDGDNESLIETQTSPVGGSPALDNWRQWGPIFPFTDPPVDDFVATNLGSATLDSTHGGIHIIAPRNSGTSLRIWTIDAGAMTFDEPVSFQLSHNGQHFEEMFTFSVTDFLTPDEIGFFANEESDTYQLQTTLLHWLQSGNDLTAAFISMFLGIDSQAFGLVLRESSSGKLLTFQLRSTSSGLLLEVVTYDDETTLNTTEFSQLLL